MKKLLLLNEDTITYGGVDWVKGIIANSEVPRNLLQWEAVSTSKQEGQEEIRSVEHNERQKMEAAASGHCAPRES